MNIAIFGGRFDPPHIGHFIIAQQIKDYYPDIEKVILVPTNKHQWKDCVASPRQRLEMLRLIKMEGIEVSDVEIVRGGVSYSIDTIMHFRDKPAIENIYWVVGSDIIQEFDKWERRDQLLKISKFLVYPRDPYHLPASLPQGFDVVNNRDLITTNLSSTIIKKRLSEGLSIKNFVPDKINDYIKENNLYA